MRIRLSEEAREFLRNEVRYLRDRSPAAARRLLDRMNQASRNLADFPLMGPHVEEGIVPGTRRLVVGEYILIYDVADGAVDIASIRHGRMESPPRDVDEDFDYEADTANPKP